MVPEITLRCCEKSMPVIGMGIGVNLFSKENDKKIMKDAFIEAMKAGYRHFDTSIEYPSEQPLGEAIIKALQLGVVKSRDELFITSKQAMRFAEKDLVLCSINMSLRSLQLDYLDLFPTHVPWRLSPEISKPPIPKDKIFPLDIKEVWEGMEACKNLGLTKAIGVSNFSCKKVEELLSTAKIPPAVNQVEMSIMWHQKQLTEFFKAKGILSC